jgi:hypothetical protein
MAGQPMFESNSTDHDNPGNILQSFEGRLSDIPKSVLIETNNGKVWIPASAPSLHDWLLGAAPSDEERALLEDTIEEYDDTQEFLEACFDIDQLASMEWESGGPFSWSGLILAAYAGNRAYLIEWQDDAFWYLKAIVEPADNKDLIAQAFQYLTGDKNVPTKFSLRWPGLQPMWKNTDAENEPGPTSRIPTIEELPLFDGYPYLVTRVVPTLLHVILLPRNLSRDALIDAGREQACANKLPTCLVLSEDRSVFFDVDGGQHSSGSPPRADNLVTDKLKPAIPLSESIELTKRAKRLEEFIAHSETNGYLLGDLRKGGRDATPNEALKLSGRNSEGVPSGLVGCQGCGEWAGECLDPNPQLNGLIVTVSCRCQNDSRCAQCAEPLYERKINANYYEPRDGQIWHVPGFCGLDHRCKQC